MTEDEIRVIVRQAVQRALTASAADRAPSTPAVAVRHPSMARYHLPRSAEDVMCVIEPAVRCDQCGYCQCHGH